MDISNSADLGLWAHCQPSLWDNSRVNEAILYDDEAVRKQSRRSLPLRFMEGPC